MLMIWCFDPHMYAWSFILSNLQPSFITSGSKTNLLLIHSIPDKVILKQSASKIKLWVVLCYNILLLTLWIIFDVNYILHNTFIEFPVSELSLQNYRREASKRAYFIGLEYRTFWPQPQELCTALYWKIALLKRTLWCQSVQSVTLRPQKLENIMELSLVIHVGHSFGGLRY